MQVNVCYLSVIHNRTQINLDIDSVCPIKSQDKEKAELLSIYMFLILTRPLGISLKTCKRHVHCCITAVLWFSMLKSSIYNVGEPSLWKQIMFFSSDEDNVSFQLKLQVMWCQLAWASMHTVSLMTAVSTNLKHLIFRPFIYFIFYVHLPESVK